VRGSEITQEFLDYEKRQAAALGMLFETWRPQLRQEDMVRILAGHAAKAAAGATA
jgi:hypothetical protein